MLYQVISQPVFVVQLLPIPQRLEPENDHAPQSTTAMTTVFVACLWGAMHGMSDHGTGLQIGGIEIVE